MNLTMEPVPETEGMEEFKAAPVPMLRLQESAVSQPVKNDYESIKPPSIRRSTDPNPQSPRSPILSSAAMAYRPRNTSPLARGHTRSKSTTSALAPPMSRAQSMPGVSSAGHLLINTQQHRPASPLGSPRRVRTPRKPADEVFPGLPNRGISDLREAGSLTSPLTFKPALERSSSPILGVQQPALLPRTRRPASPLRHASAGGLSTPSTPSSASSPLYPNSKFDSFLGSSSYSSVFSYPGSFTSSSVPSTPTSARSRSPSISSLETIPDTPDAEEAALEAERIAQLKADADAADGIDDAKKTSGDGSSSRGRTLGLGFGSRDKRKRWSVCGAERRGDLNLDTIWED